MRVRCQTQREQHTKPVCGAQSHSASRGAVPFTYILFGERHSFGTCSKAPSSGSTGAGNSTCCEALERVLHYARSSGAATWH